MSSATTLAPLVGFEPAEVQLVAETRRRKARGLSHQERLTYWTSSVGFVAAALALPAVAGWGGTRHLWVGLFLLGCYAVASRLAFEAGPFNAVPTELVLIEMLFLLPASQVPLWVMAGNVLGAAPEYLSRKVPVERALIRVSSSWFALGPALVFTVMHTPMASLKASALGILGLALAAQFVVDLGSSAFQEWGALGIRPQELVRPMLLCFTIDLVLAPAGLLAAIAAGTDDAALALPLPLLAVIALTTRERQRRIDDALELSSAYRGTAFLLGDVVEADDAYTGAHSRDVLELSLTLCDELGVDAGDRLDTEFVALLHDVGKLRVPGEILGKAGPLTWEERAIVNMHTIEGQRLLQRVGGRLAEVGSIVRSCHERWDGRGYPDGLEGESIPLVARIVAACDAFSAMTTHRPYRPALSVGQALSELEANAGTQFDPTVADALIALVRRGRAGIERSADLLSA
ncbi:MAG: HD-GYP domain-containing protein [Actinobacteria bacterium]|nr:HD-GYP domain-containing protein [Actinomycetota bacterium]